MLLLQLVRPSVYVVVLAGDETRRKMLLGGDNKKKKEEKRLRIRYNQEGTAVTY